MTYDCIQKYNIHRVEGYKCSIQYKFQLKHQKNKNIDNPVKKYKTGLVPRNVAVFFDKHS